MTRCSWLPAASGRQDPRIDATHITSFYVLDGLLTREWDAAWDAILHLILPAHRAGHHPARDHRPDHPGLGAGGAERGLRAHRRGQGPDAAARSAAGTCCATRMLPVVTTIGLQTGLLLAGAVLTETVFAFNGIGAYLVRGDRSAATIPCCRASSCSSPWSTSLVNLLVDLSYGVIDPRVRAAMSLTTAAAHRRAAAGRPARRRPLGAERRARRQPLARARSAGCAATRSPIVGAVIVALLRRWSRSSRRCSRRTTRHGRVGSDEVDARAASRARPPDHPLGARPLRLATCSPADLRRPADPARRRRLHR